MIDLQPYADHFDDAYPRYNDERYAGILLLVEELNDERIRDLVTSESFPAFVDYLAPLIAIKNYKSQIPFPMNFVAAIDRINDVKNIEPADPPDLAEDHKQEFDGLISIQGFELPTVSAVFHFCHSDKFPIVDKNVKRACALLVDRDEDGEFVGFNKPILPAINTSSENKLDKYVLLIQFIDRIKLLHEQRHGEPVTYRFIDKALMVLGKKKLRQQVEGV